MEERITKSATAKTVLDGSVQTEQELLIDRENELLDWLKSRYEAEMINGWLMFRVPSGIAHLVTFPEELAFCFEYANNEREAKNYVLEDGDWFYMGEMTFDEMKEAMLRELEEIN